MNTKLSVKNKEPKVLARAILTIETENKTYEDYSSKLLLIDENHIVFELTKQIVFAANEFKSAAIRILYGNHSNIIFFLDKLESVNGKQISLFAPIEKESNMLPLTDLKIKATCSGYKKLCLMIKPKHVKKEN